MLLLSNVLAGYAIVRQERPILKIIHIFPRPQIASWGRATGYGQVARYYLSVNAAAYHR